jgi:GNAT superfamily N-acetyltransferase
VSWIIYPIDALERSASSLRREPFNSGQSELDRYLKQYANKNDESGIARTFVALPAEGSQVIAGYYACTANVIDPRGLPAELRERLPGYLTPAILIGKLAVDLSVQGRGLGKRLLFHAFENVIDVSRKVGVYAVRVDAIDEAAKDFYKKFGFLELQDRPLSLFIRMETIKQALNIGPPAQS